MKKEVTIFVLFLLLLASCQPYGKAIDTTGVLTTPSLNMQDIVAEAISSIQPTALGEMLTLPNIHTSDENTMDAEKLQNFMIDEACKGIPDLRDENGNILCGVTDYSDYDNIVVDGDVVVSSYDATVSATDNSLSPFGVGHAFYGRAILAPGSPDPYSRPDLETTSFSLTKTTYSVGETVNGQTEVENVGDYLATLFGRVKLDGTYIAPISYGAPLLNAGETSTGYLSFPAPSIPGTYIVTVSPQLVHDIWHPTAAISIGGAGTGYLGGDGTWVSESNLNNNDDDIQITVINFTLPTGPYADLTVDMTTWDLIPINPVVGGSANVLVDIKNIGTQTCNDGTITTYLNSVQLNVFPLTHFVTSLAPGQSTRIGDQFQVTQPGVNEFKVVAECTDPADAISVNNEGIFSFTVHGQYDLSATDIQVVGGPFTDTDSIDLQLVTGNPGPTAATADVYLYIDGNKEYEYTVSIAPSGVNAETHQIQPLSAGTHDLTLVIDPNDALFETDENNNVELVQLQIVSSSALPDLELQKLEITPAIIHGGETAYLDIELKNIGVVVVPAGGSYTINWASGGIATFPLPEIQPGATWTHTETYPNLPAGTHTIYFDSDAGVPESDDTNNDGSVTFTVLPAIPKPDFGINVVMTPAYLTMNDQIDLDVQITNLGTIPTTQGTEYHVIIDGMLVDEIAVPIIGTMGGMIGSGTFTSTAVVNPLSSGIHTIEVVIDPNNQVDELNENNNVWSQTVDVSGAALPDFGIDVVMTPSSPTMIDQIDLDVQITNLGSVPTTQSTEYHVLIDNIIVDEIAVPALGTMGGMIGSGTFTSTAVINPLSQGPHNIEVVVDPNNQITELNENNNIWSVSVNVQGAGVSYIYLVGAKITYPPTPAGPTFVIGTCAANPQVAQMLGNVICNSLDSGDGIIKAFPNHPGLGWTMVISGGTAQDVSNTVDLFIDIDNLGPDEIYNEMNIRTPNYQQLGLELYADYYNAIGTKMHYLNYVLRGDPLSLVGFPMQMHRSDIPDVLSTAASSVDAVYDWDPELQKWESYRVGVPSNLAYVDKHNGYFLVMNTAMPQTIVLYDIRDQGGATTVEPGRMLFTPTEYSDLSDYSHVFDLSQPVHCQMPIAAPAGWMFQQVTPGKIDIGQSCWVTSIGGVLQ